MKPCSNALAKMWKRWCIQQSDVQSDCPYLQVGLPRAPMSNRLTRTRLSRPKLLSSLNDDAIALLNQKGNHVGEENGLSNARCASNDKHAGARFLGFEFVIQPIHDLSTHFCIALAHYQLVLHSLITQNVVGKLLHFISFPLAWLWRLLHCLVQPLAEGVLLRNNLSQSGMWNILLNTETTTENQSPYLNKQPTNTKKTLDWVKGAKKPCSCSKNHAHVSFRFFEGGSAIASQDKRLNHLFSTLGTMTMTQKVSAQSVPCHLLLKKKRFVAFLQSSLSHARLFLPTSATTLEKTTYMQLKMNVSDCIISIVFAIATP